MALPHIWDLLVSCTSLVQAPIFEVAVYLNFENVFSLHVAYEVPLTFPCNAAFSRDWLICYEYFYFLLQTSLNS